MEPGHPLEKSLGSISVFLKKVFSSLKKDGIDVSGYELDHICYRVETLERYHKLKKVLEKHGKLLSETIIAGRPIATYKLKELFIFRDKTIKCIELPCPKKSSPYQEGFEHVEFVINLSFQDFMKKYPSIKFETGASSKEVNPDIQIKYAGFSVKFHHNTLEYVIKYLQ